MCRRRAIFQTAEVCLLLAIGSVPTGVMAFDGNDNGVSDVWESRYQIANPSPGTDSDGDGQSDREEALSGTDPLDPAAMFLLGDRGSSSRKALFELVLQVWQDVSS